MGRSFKAQTNLTGGELDPLLLARVDTDRYANAVATLLNMYVLSSGGATRRAGLKFVDDEGSVTVEMTPFSIFRTDLLTVQGYLIEFRSDNTIHFYTNGDRIAAVSIASPFTSGLDKIRYEQFDNVLYLVHPDFPPQMLTRTNDNTWTITAVTFIMPATQSITGITRAAQVATATSAAPHGYSTGQIVAMSGADQTEYNGDFQITVTGASTFTYTVTGSPATATGTLLAGRVYWGTTGYPNSITFFEQRMILGGTATHPQTVFGSESGVILNFVTAVGDSDPFEFTIAQATSRILHLSATQLIIVSTYDKEITIQGSEEKPLTPTNFHIKPHTPYGIRDAVRPLIIAGEVLFVTKHGKKMRLLSDKIESSTQKRAPDISIVSAHLSGLGIIDIAYQLEPDSVIWLVTSDGKLLSVTFDKDSELLAWAQHATDGLFKHVAVIPHDDTDQVWVAVEREIDGSTLTYIEVMDSTLNTDAAITLTDSPAKTVWTGLGHLEGETVDVLADGVVIPQQTVSGGQITIPNAALTIEVGMHYTSTVVDLPPHLFTNMGTSEGQNVTVNRCTVRLHNSIGLTINGSVVPFRRWTQDNFDEAVAEYSGEKVIDIMSAADGVVTIEQTQPLPFTLLGIIKEITVNG